MTLEPILEVCHLSKSFGTHQVLRDVNFTVHPGDVTSILGSSGSGKSTLLRCINLLERPNQGEVRFLQVYYLLLVRCVKIKNKAMLFWHPCCCFLF